MTRQAYVVAGEVGRCLSEARSFAARELGLEGANPDIIVRQFSLLSVDDARALRDIATLAPAGGGQKVLIVCAQRMFHEAQNALLKLFEEPPEDTVLILIVPTTGILLNTMRSRLAPLPGVGGKALARKRAREEEEVGDLFIGGTTAAREKMVAKLLDRAKSDKDEEKQAARADALRILEAVEQHAHEAWVSEAAGPKKTAEYALLLRDLDRLIPILHERSAPLKQIFEHVLITLPAGF